ncbi:MAG: hypothetical protein E7400_00800 [Ruminococcaceae bacterium]|nr:hypothetical protein [Oscillospiraceae bacterium]
MLTIKKIITTEEVENYLSTQGIPLSMDYQQFMGIYDGDTLIGMGSINLVDLKVYMNFIYTEDDDFGLRHGLAKSLLNMADLSGIKTVYGSNPELSDLYSILRFQKDGDEYVLQLEGYFTADSCQQ